MKTLTKTLDYDAVIKQKLCDCVDSWYVLQSRENYEKFYLYYSPTVAGQLVCDFIVAKDIPALGWKLVNAEAFNIGRDKRQNWHHFYQIIQTLPVLNPEVM